MKKEKSYLPSLISAIGGLLTLAVAKLGFLQSWQELLDTIIFILGFIFFCTVIILILPEGLDRRFTLMWRALRGNIPYVYYNRDDGMLLLGKRKQRNVPMRVETLRILLEALESESTKSYEDLFKKYGCKIGQSFADDFRAELAAGEGLKDVKGIDKLKMWAEYDSNAGWGKFDFVSNPNTLTWEVPIQNCFLCDSKTKDKKFCKFMEGYLCATISGVLDADFDVKFKEINGDCCSFTVKNKCEE